MKWVAKAKKHMARGPNLLKKSDDRGRVHACHIELL